MLRFCSKHTTELKENFYRFNKQNDFYENMFSTKGQREYWDNTGLSCPFHEAHPHTCVWNKTPNLELYEKSTGWECNKID